jgi:hypothetical protein
MNPHDTPSLTKQENIEEWRDVPGYVGYYQASSFGRVRSLDRLVPRRNSGKYTHKTVKGQIMAFRPNRKGARPYLLVFLRRDGDRHVSSVHQLVAETFIGPRPDGHDTHHKDGNPTNNRASNLEYVPSHEHLSTHSAGEKNWNAKLTEGQVEEIRKALAKKEATVRALSQVYGVSVGTIKSIRKGRTWKSL